MSEGKRKPKFRKGQVVSVRSFYGNWAAGQTGPGFAGKHGWRHGWQFGKIVKILAPGKSFLKYCYFLDGWMSARTENDLRAISPRMSRERNGGKDV